MQKKSIKKGSLGVLCLIIVFLIALVLSSYKTIAKHINLGLDLQGGFEICLR